MSMIYIDVCMYIREYIHICKYIYICTYIVYLYASSWFFLSISIYQSLGIWKCSDLGDWSATSCHSYYSADSIYRNWCVRVLRIFHRRGIEPYQLFHRRSNCHFRAEPEWWGNRWNGSSCCCQFPPPSSHTTCAYLSSPCIYHSHDINTWVRNLSHSAVE